MQLWKAGIYALLFSLYYTLCTLVFGSLYSQSFINWGHEASAYYVELKIVNSFVSFSQVALTFFYCLRFEPVLCFPTFSSFIVATRGTHFILDCNALFFYAGIPFSPSTLCLLKGFPSNILIGPQTICGKDFLVETVLIILFSVAGFVTSQKKEFLK